MSSSCPRTMLLLVAANHAAALNLPSHFQQTRSLLVQTRVVSPVQLSLHDHAACHASPSTAAAPPMVQPDVEDLTADTLLAMALFALSVAMTASPVDAATAATATTMTSGAVFDKAVKRALGGGVSGALAGVFQVLLLMWLRTTMNYQYRNGGSTREALDALYAEGGIARFYRGISFALFQTPLSRFGDTAANSGVLALLATSDLPVGLRTAAASGAASLWRIGLTPIDTMKTSLQVTGTDGYEVISQKVRAEGFPVLFQGALANAFASFVGNYPWYLTFNTLDESLPLAPADDLKLKLCRSAILGISAACVSDTLSNSIRVLKTTRQTSAETISYPEALRLVLDKDGWAGLFTRGLGTRLGTNALQAAIFTVVWKLGEEYISKAGLFG